MKAVPVWDLPTRIFHWALAVCVGVALIVTPEGGSGFAVHSTAGFLALLLVAFRVPWGFLGSLHSRFADFLYAPAKVLEFALQHLRFKVTRHVGHNPLGGWMVIVLLVFIAGAAITGLLGGFWRGLHGLFGNLLIFLVLLHIFGVVVDTLLTRDNIVWAMITGRKKVDDAAAAREPRFVGWWRGLVLALLIAGCGGYLYGQVDWAGLAAQHRGGGGEGD
jgi:cytochrome b